jgi:hypothetical protein
MGAPGEDVGAGIAAPFQLANGNLILDRLRPRAALLCEALTAMGVEDAGATANILAEQEGRWTELLPDQPKA